MTAYFMIAAWDAPGSPERRAGALADHFAHIEAQMESIAVAGPLKDAGGASIGSLLIFKARTAAEAEALLLADPYSKAGVWERYEIHPFIPAAGEWIGGKTW